jgi:branched-chain amino acid transport system substrate-binding protein
MNGKLRSKLAALAAMSFILATLVQASAQESPIRIGLIGPFTGVFATFGGYLEEGATMALEEVGYEVAGRSVELFIEDSAGNPEQLVTRLRALQDRDGVHVIVGPVTGSEGLAALDWARDSGMPLIVAYSAPEDITMRQRAHNVVRAGWTGAQPMFPYGEYVAEELGYRRIVAIGQDYSFPYNQLGGFLRGFCAAGGEEVLKVWHPVGTDDYSSIFATLPRDVDAALVISGGADVIPFVRQWFDFGMDQEMPLLTASNVPDSTVLPELGEDALGFISPLQYAEGLDTERFVAWREAYEERYGRLPAAVAEHAYVGVQMALRAAEAVDGRIEDRDAFIEALRATEMPDAPRGPFHLDEYGNPVQNIYIREVQEVDGRLMNVPIRTYEAVSQFGPFVDDPEAYMALPPDSRDYPPGKCEELVLPE